MQSQSYQMQKENKSLQDYTRHFETSRKILESHISGDIRFSKFVQQIGNYIKNSDEDVKEQFASRTSKHFFAFIYLDISNQQKYDLVLKNSNSQKL